MRIGFDARALDRAGVVTYARSLLAEYARLGLEVVVFCEDRVRDLIPSSEHFQLVAAPQDPKTRSGQLRFLQLVLDCGVDLVHVPSHLAPGGLPVPMVCTIHDVIPLIYPRSIWNPFARAKYRSRLLQAVRQATYVITVSQITSSTLSVYAGVDLAKVRVVHNGVGEEFRPVEDVEIRARVRRTYALPERFALWVGEFRRHKNLAFLIDAWQHLQARLDQPLALVLAGPQDGTFGDIKALAVKKGLQDLVFFPGYIRGQDLPVVYSMASVFVFPSLYEGFGLPPLEAMACGTPCVVSNSSALPEVTGGAALVFNPTVREQLIDAVARVLTNPEVAATLRKEGFRQAALFSWQKAAQQTLEVYEGALSSRLSN